MRQRFGLVLGLVLVGCWPCAGSAQAVDASANAVALPYTYEHTLRSEINGQEYRVLVALPYSYVAAGPNDSTRYPSLYMLDGHMAIRTVPYLYRLSNIGPVGDVVLIGISPPEGGRPWGTPPGAWRDLNYTPPPMRDSITYTDIGGGTEGTMFSEDGSQLFGGAPTLLRILREEVIPFVERTYRVTEDRGLHGHSMGGLFATYALLTEPDLFGRYAITSPSLWWDRGALLELEPEFASEHAALPKQVYLSIGSEENVIMTSVMWQLARALCRASWEGTYTDLTLTVETIPDEDHVSPVSISRALRTLYPAEPLAQPPRSACNRP